MCLVAIVKYLAAQHKAFATSGLVHIIRYIKDPIAHDMDTATNRMPVFVKTSKLDGV